MSQLPNPKHVLPSSPYGISSTQYPGAENPLLPLPQRNLMLAANRLNEYRYRKLSEKQRVFIDVYLSSDLNAVEAAKRAGYCKDVPQDDNYEKACAAIGRRLRKSKHIETGILLALDYHAEHHKIDTNALLTELKYMAFSNMGDFFVNEGGDPRLQMPEDHERGKLAALSEITVDSYDEGRGDNKREVKRVKFKMHDKMTAIDKLLKVAAARGDPLLAGLGGGQENNGASTVNVFNVLPVPSGEFLPAPAVTQHEQFTPEVQATISGQPMQTLLMQRTAPTVLQEPVRWVQPDKPQPKQLTIDHEK